MPSLPPSFDSPGARRALALVLFVGLVGLVLLANLARIVESPVSAARPLAWGPAALGKIRGQLAAIQTGRNDFDIADAKLALASVPLSGDPFAALAAASLAADPRGAGGRERALLTEALRRDPRSRPARILLLRNLAASNDLKGAFEQLDVLNRLSPVLVARAMDSIARLVDSPPRMDLALRSLKGHPSLYGPFVNGMVGKDKPRELVTQFARGLPTEVLADPNIRNSVIGQLVTVGEFPLARSIWLGGLKSAPRGLVFSPDFTDRGGASPFTWQMPTGTSGSAEFGREGGLAVVYYDRSPGQLAQQVVTLAPGRYVLSAQFKLVSGTADNVRVQVSCHGASALLADLPLFAASPAAVRRQVEFVVPAQGCAGQILAVVGAISQKRSETEVTVQRVEIAPAGAN